MSKDQTFSSRQVPWMGVGESIEGAVNVDEAIQMAGLDWEVVAQPAGYRSTIDNSWKVHPKRVAVVRLDTDVALGNMADAYEMVQYREAFDLMNEINPEFLAAGSLKGGKQAFMVVRAPDQDFQVLDGEDAHELFIVLRTSHDGSKGVEISLLPLRGTCMNQLALPSLVTGAKQRFSLRHTRSVRSKMDQAKTVLTNLDGYAREFEQTALALAEIDLELEEAKRILSEDVVSKDLKTHDDRVDKILDVYRNSSFNGYQGNGWGLLNAVGEFHDHYQGGDNRRNETRFLQGIAGSTQEAVHRTARALLRRR